MTKHSIDSEGRKEGALDRAEDGGEVRLEEHGGSAAAHDEIKSAGCLSRRACL